MVTVFLSFTIPMNHKLIHQKRRLTDANMLAELMMSYFYIADKHCLP